MSPNQPTHRFILPLVASKQPTQWLYVDGDKGPRQVSAQEAYAAAELIAALKTMTEWCEHAFGIDHVTEELPVEIEQARAALVAAGVSVNRDRGEREETDD